jgi:hypothetical protein
MKTRLPLYTLVGALAAPMSLLAQAAPMGPPPIAQIFREVVKQGKGAAHEKLETAWSRALENAKYPVNFIAISSLTGPSEAWFLSGYASWAEYEKANNAINASAALAAVDAKYRPQEEDMLTDSRGMLARYRDSLSYLPGNEPLGVNRYFSITRIQIRPGHVGEFEEARKMIKAAHEKAKLSDGFVIYEVTSGAPAGTFLIFVARKTLAELDQAAQIHGPAYQAALGGDSAQKKLAALASSGTITAETNQFAFSPGMSFPSKETVAADPAFWTPKPATAAPKKPAPKTP